MPPFDHPLIVPSLDDLPESIPIADLYEETDDGFRFAGVKGYKPEDDFNRVKGALDKERADHRSAKNRWKALGDREPDDVLSALDEVEELRERLEAAGGEPDEQKIEALVEKRLGRILSPKEREIAQLKASLEDANLSGSEARNALNELAIGTKVNDLALKSCHPDAIADVKMAAKFMLERNEEGEIVTKDGIGDIAPNMPVDMWLTEMLEKRPLWNKSSGGGSGGRGGGSTGGVQKNPFTYANWDTSAQQAVAKEKGVDEWRKLASAAGVDPMRPQRPPAPNGQA